MINTVILVAIGGAIGAILREFLMLTVGVVWVGFIRHGLPLDILIANVVASFLLGLAFALHGRKVVSDSVYVLVGTGVMGGMSTFSSFVFGAVRYAETSALGELAALIYVALSLALGFAAVLLGIRVGGVPAVPK